ncbi:carboxyl-terminal-processing peptidase 1, chloroplastic [Dorcoceras hygrometricum]|uniref:Carboxyl-terminal-processing peptidase 1, chloroplastic n=1 Tax=Dorcoceras hygrometricum TaxID=472368 RepID=A0A2Z7BNX0_9LAMI|nr:carboxyl-terminal-processing peptidase 1, chloroplastic [Dorcoceras hygrometricum]
MSEKSNAIIGAVTTGYECLPPSCDGLTGPDDHGPMISRLIHRGITDSACKNQLVVVSVQYGPFNTYIPIRSTTIGKSRVARDPIAMHTSWRSNSDIASVTSIGYPRMRASGEYSTTKHRLLHASGPHPIPPPNDPKIQFSAYLFLEVRNSMYYVSPSSTSEGSTRRFDLYNEYRSDPTTSSCENS